MLVFGNDIHHRYIRLACIFILVEYRGYFSDVIKRTYGEQNVVNFVETVSKNYSWAYEYIILAISIALNRPVVCLSISEQNFCCSHEYCNNKNQKKNQQFLIGLKNNHFVPLLPKKTTFNTEIEANNNQFQKMPLYTIKKY